MTSVLLAQTELGTDGLQQWMLDNLVPLLLITVAVILVWLGGTRGDNAAVMKRVGGVLAALAILGLAVSGAAVDLGTWVAGLFTSTGMITVLSAVAALVGGGGV